jgi:hypothetical protein
MADDGEPLSLPSVAIAQIWKYKKLERLREWRVYCEQRG